MKITLGSLFDGAGGFPYAATMAGITPVWAGEIEPFPIRVTSRRFPHMKHLGNITGINGAEIDPVDVITFGSPCQDLSVANGKRKGLGGARSGLFREAIRIIKEMREETDGRYPAYIVWENVFGAFSSNKGADFREVLQAIVSVKKSAVLIARPEKWTMAGEIVGDDFSVAWRTLDAQFWGVPQRRRRIYLVADFGGQRAGHIQFERESVLGDTPQGGAQGQETAGGSGKSPAGTSGIRYLTPWDAQSKRVFEESGATPTLDGADGGGRSPGGFVMTAGFNGHKSATGTIQYAEERAPTIKANMPPNAITGICFPDVARTLAARADSSPCVDRGQNIVAVFMGGQGEKARGIAYSETVSPTLKSALSGSNTVPDVVTAVNQNASGEVREGAVANTLSTNGNASGRNAPLVRLNTAVYDARGNGDGRTVNTLTGDHENRVTDYTAVCIQGNTIDRGDASGAEGKGARENVSYTLNTADRHAVAYSLDRASYNQGQNAQFDISVQEEQAQTVVAKGANAVAVPQKNRYIVRRLTPLECCRLQGYPDYWAKDLATPEPTEEETDEWCAIFETHRQATTPEKKAKTRNQVKKWLTDPHSDSAEYKMWGNSLAIPCAYNVLAGIAEEIRGEGSRTMTVKEQKAIMRIKEAYLIAERMGKTLIVAYSGGKDSDVLLDLAIKSGVPFEVQHNHTTADAPQTVYHIRGVFKRLTEQGIPCKINDPPEIEDADGKRVRATMWSLIPKKGMPPTRLARYCCGYFKERRFENQHLLMGIRWAESTARKTRGLHESLRPKKKDRVVFMDENDDRRKLQEICHMRNSIATNPIIDWTDREVWEYLDTNGIVTNPLYAQGLKRVGCVGCPMASEKQRREQFSMFPKYKEMYLRAFEKMIAYSHKQGRRCSWDTAEQVYNWWTDMHYNPDQMTFDFENGGIDGERSQAAGPGTTAEDI
ncbi:MAG: DNA cytosine methyltransferase [Clostridium sp.]|nr:DNA cytosine methyltransferase [Clostridium sp.]